MDDRGYCNIDGYLHQYSFGPPMPKRSWSQLPSYKLFRDNPLLNELKFIPLEEALMSTLEDKHTELLVTIDELKQQALDISKQIEVDKKPPHVWKVGDCFETYGLSSKKMIVEFRCKCFVIENDGNCYGESFAQASINGLMENYPGANPITFKEWCNGRS